MHRVLSCAGPLLVLVCRGASPSLVFPSAMFPEDVATKPQDSPQISLKLPKIPRDNPKRPLGKDCAVNPSNVFGIISKQRSERIPQIIVRSWNEFSILLSFTFLWFREFVKDLLRLWDVVWDFTKCFRCFWFVQDFVNFICICCCDFKGVLRISKYIFLCRWMKLGEI